MSAYVVSPAHINSILSFVNNKATSYSAIYAKGFRYEVRRVEELQKMAEIMYAQNVRSVGHRYPNHPEDVMVDDIEFSFEPLRSPIDIIKLCDGLAYQSCETDDWEQSLACAIVRACRDVAISSLPGYDNATWSI